MAAIQGAVEIGPGRQGVGSANQPGDEGALRQRQVLCALGEEPARQRLHTVDAGTQIDAVEIELENLILGELLLEEQRDHGFLRLPGDRSLIRQKERACELLRDGAAALGALGGRGLHHGAAETDRIDPHVQVEAVVLDGDDTIAECWRNAFERNVLTLLVHAEPRLAVGAVEGGVANAAPQFAHEQAVFHRPPHGDSGGHDHRGEEHDDEPVERAPATRIEWRTHG